jgi:hypothetical protein
MDERLDIKARGAVFSLLKAIKKVPILRDFLWRWGELNSRPPQADKNPTNVF